LTRFRKEYISEISEYLLAISLIENEECKIIQELNEERNKFLIVEKQRDMHVGVKPQRNMYLL